MNLGSERDWNFQAQPNPHLIIGERAGKILRTDTQAVRSRSVFKSGDCLTTPPPYLRLKSSRVRIDTTSKRVMKTKRIPMMTGDQMIDHELNDEWLQSRPGERFSIRVPASLSALLYWAAGHRERGYLGYQTVTDKALR
jgi:hypothetical protein